MKPQATERRFKTKHPHDVLIAAFANEPFRLPETSENVMPNDIPVPYGEYHITHTLTDGKRVSVKQIFNKDSATSIANELSRILAKKGKGIPVYEGHPDVPALAAKYPSKGAIGWITAVAANDSGAVLTVRWLDNPGERFGWFSPYWGGMLKFRDSRYADLNVASLRSFALTNDPNIEDFRLPNEDPDNDGGDTATSSTPQKEHTMDLKKLAVMLGLADTATPEEITAKLNELLAAVNAAKDAPAQVAAANEKAQKARKALTDHLVAAAIADGRITGADKPTWEARLANEAAFDAESANLAKLQPALKTAPGANPKPSAAGADSKARHEQRVALANEIQKADPSLDFSAAWAAAKAKKPELFA